MKQKISFSPPDITDMEIAAVEEVLRSGWITTGAKVKELEGKLADFLQVHKVVCLASATSAEELIFRILGIGPGDEVIVPAYTYTASAAAAIHVGAKVVFVDAQLGSTEMDYEQLETAITPATKAIVSVDLGGVLCDYKKIFSVVEKKKEIFVPLHNCNDVLSSLGSRIQETIGRIVVIADCAHALGSYQIENGKKIMAGAIADFSFFSFHAVKNLTTGEGGAACWKSIHGVSDEELYYFFQLLSLHGQSKDAWAKIQPGAWEYDIVGPWYKCNMTDIMAAIGIKQLERYKILLQRRKEIIEVYDNFCDKLGIKHIHHFSPVQYSCGHLYLTHIPGIHDRQRREIIRVMAEKGIMCNVHYKPLPMMTAYHLLGETIENYPNSYALYENEISLPLHTLLRDEEIEYLLGCLKEAVKPYFTKNNRH
ncbi:MAG: DegT/DnrJ/EryC1/StrS aminotransferase family protein [Lachnospiraceae bacterium]|nr:DegT/DnrJ/EryC1/StrS aminotransferase family protein [Lachnospiraceae bacterium]